MSDSGPGRREVAYRLFAAEFDDAEFSYSESDEERAPNFVVTPTGARVNRLFAVGVLTEVEDVNPEMVRGRVVDPTGAFVTYAGQYQPDELAFLERTEPPTFLALSGKARTFEPDDGDRVYTSVRPESVSEVDAETRDRWVVSAAERTLERVGIVASAIESGLEGDRLRAALEEADVDERLADGVALALDYYGTTPAYLEALRETAIEAVEVVAGERDEVSRLDVAPDEGSAGTEAPRGEGGEAAGASEAGPLATLELEEPEVPEPEPVESDAEADTAGATTESPTTADPDVETGTDTETGTTAAGGAEPDATADTAEEPETGAVSGTDPAPEGAADPDVGAGEADETDAGGSTEEGDLEPEAATEAAAEPEPEVSPDAAETEATAESVEGAGQEPGDDEDFDPGEFELDDEERREVEEEYGTEFSTADEVESPDEGEEPETDEEPDAETESETPTEAEMAEAAPGEEAEASAETGAEQEADDEPDAADEPDAEAVEADEEGEDPAAESAEDVDLEDAVMSTMEALDDGDGADQAELVSTVAEEHGADPEAVEEAIQDALMSGRCYEPADGVLKSI